MGSRLSAADFAIILLVMALWGASYTVAKLGLAVYPPVFLLALRFCLTALILLPFVRRIPPGKLPQLLAISVAYGGLSFTLQTYALHMLDSITVMILSRLQVPFAAILALIFLDDKLGWRKVAGMILAFVGVIVVLGGPRFTTGAMSIFAAFMCIVASFSWALANIFIKKLGPMDNTALNGVIHLLAAPQFLILSLLFEHGQVDALAAGGWRAFLLVVFLAVFVGVVAETLWYVMLHKHDVSLTTPFTLMVPLFGIAASAMVLKEPITPHMLVGGLMVLSGIGIIVARMPHVGSHGGISVPHPPSLISRVLHRLHLA